MSGVPNPPAPFVEEGWRSDYAIVVAGANFGCGSSREQAPAALQIAGVRAVVAGSYARIFYRNAVDGGRFLPLEFDSVGDGGLGDGGLAGGRNQGGAVSDIRTGDPVTVSVPDASLTNERTGVRYGLKPLGDAEGIIRAGGLFAFARASGLL